jgi:hypothetical protein
LLLQAAVVIVVLVLSLVETSAWSTMDLQHLDPDHQVVET